MGHAITLIPGDGIWPEVTGAAVAVVRAAGVSIEWERGRNLANPTAMIQTAVLLLGHLGERAAAARIQTALERVLAEGRVHTRDLRGEATTTQFTDAVIRALDPSPPHG